MNKSRVALVMCQNYNQDTVYTALKKGVDFIGGIEAFIDKKESVLIKPNILRQSEPDLAVTTHPEVFASTIQILKELGYDKITYGDSPGTGSMEKAADGSGISKKANELNVLPADFSNGITVDFLKGKAAKSFVLCKAVVESDAIINICKMKTHALERITGAVKNIYGCVYGINKGAGHVKYPDPDSFAKMLADLHSLVNPRIHIMDGITAMEGNGPASGTPVDMHILLFSSDPVALDTVFCHIINLNPEFVPTNIYGELAGLGYWHSNKIEVITEDGIITPEEAGKRFGHYDFDVYRGEIEKGRLENINWLMKLMKQRPYIDSKLCIKCGICVKSCPLSEKAIEIISDNIPKYDYNKCIRCFCCQEMCPKKAISVKTPLLRRILNRKASNKKAD